MTADAAVVLPMPISPVANIEAPSPTASSTSSMPISMAWRASSRVIAGPWAMLAVPHADLAVPHPSKRGDVGVHPHVGHDHPRADMPGEDVDGRSSGGEVGHHARRDLGRVGAHAFGGHAVVGRHDGHDLVGKRRGEPAR